MNSANNKKGGTAKTKTLSTKNKKKLNLENNFTLTYVIYKDHVEFRNCNSITMRSCVRETVGWISFENTEVICICSDVSAKPFANIEIKESGFVILKSEILYSIDIDLGKCFICNREFILGNSIP